MNSVTNNIPQETINSVLIDILKGAKDAGSEIYGASKTGIVKAVDFAQEQAPLVVQEFLQWKFAQGVIWATVAVIALVALGIVFYKCKKIFSENSDGSEIGGVFGMMISALIFCVVIGEGLLPNVEQMVKVKVAPRVYMIEWVSDQVQGNHNNNNNHR